MLLQQLISSFGGPSAAAKRRVAEARRELIGAVAPRRPLAAAERRAADAAIVALAAAANEQPFDLRALGPGEFQVVYASGGFPLWRATADLAEKLSGGARRRPSPSNDYDGDGSGVVASQQFDPRTRRLVNRVDYGPLVVSAYGEFTSLSDGPPVFPAAVRADVQGGRLDFTRGGGGGEDDEAGGRGGGWAVSLPIRGQGLFEVLYADQSIRIFKSQSSISVQMPRRRR